MGLIHFMPALGIPTAKQASTPPGFQELEEFVGNPLEIFPVYLNGKRCHMVIRLATQEHTNPLPINPLATYIYQETMIKVSRHNPLALARIGEKIHGDVIVLDGIPAN